MKVLDMFGCCLPVCAYNFNWYSEHVQLIYNVLTTEDLVILNTSFVIHSLSELVKHNENSLMFANENELAQQLKMWFQDFPNNETQRQLEEKFRQNLGASQKFQWHINWLVVYNILYPYFQ